MHPDPTRREALGALARGVSLSEASRVAGVARTWQGRTNDGAGSARCDGLSPARGAGYAALLGYHLGDGCLSHHRGSWALRVSCDGTLPGIAGRRGGPAGSKDLTQRRR